MEFKQLYQFTVDEEREVEKESKRTNKKTGDVTITKKMVKEKVPVEVKIKKPSRRQLEEAELQYSIEVSNCVKKGILTKAMLAKKYADTGGTFSEEGFKEYGELYKKILDLQNEFTRLETIAKPTKEQKEKIKEVKEEIVKIKRDLVEVESGLQNLFEHTADTRAQNKLLLWYALHLTYVQDENDKEPLEYFVGGDYDEKLDDYYEKEEESSELYSKIIQKVTTVLAFWFFNQASTEDEFAKIIEDVEKGEL